MAQSVTSNSATRPAALQATVVDLSDISTLGESFVIVPRHLPDPSKDVKAEEYLELAKGNRLIITDYKPNPTAQGKDFPAHPAQVIQGFVIVRTDTSTLGGYVPPPASATGAAASADVAPPPNSEAPNSLAKSSGVANPEALDKSLKKSDIPVEAQKGAGGFPASLPASNSPTDAPPSSAPPAASAASPPANPPSEANIKAAALEALSKTLLSQLEPFSSDPDSLRILKANAHIFTLGELAEFPHSYPGIYTMLAMSKYLAPLDEFVALAQKKLEKPVYTLTSTQNSAQKLEVSTIGVPALVGASKPPSAPPKVGNLPVDMFKYIKKEFQSEKIQATSSVEVLDGLSAQAVGQLKNKGAGTISQLASLSEINPEGYRELTSQVNRLEDLALAAVILLSFLDQPV